MRRRRLTYPLALTPTQHELRVALKTLRLADAMAGVMGGPNKAQARATIKRLTGRTVRGNPRRRWKVMKEGAGWIVGWWSDHWNQYQFTTGDPVYSTRSAAEAAAKKEELADARVQGDSRAYAAGYAYASGYGENPRKRHGLRRRRKLSSILRRGYAPNPRRRTAYQALLAVSRSLRSAQRALEACAWTGAEACSSALGRHLDALRQHLDNASGRTSTVISALRACRGTRRSR